MTDARWQRSAILAFTSVFTLCGFVGAGPSNLTSDRPSKSTSAPGDPIQVHIVAPDDYIGGGIFKLQAVYEADGELVHVEVDDRLLASTESFVLRLPRRERGELKEVRAEVRHPKYKPATEVIAAEPGSGPLAITVRPMRWTTDKRHGWIKPTFETSVAGLEHLRWIRTSYFQRPERLTINEAFQKDHRLVALLAYGGGGKKDEWEVLRQESIAEWEALAKIMEERSHEACPPGYVLETLINRPCGALVLVDTYIPPEDPALRAAREKEEFRRMEFAQTDLAKRLQMDRMTIRIAVYQRTMWDTTAIGCPEEGKAYEEEEVPGYLILLQPPNESHYYHGKENELPFYCDEDQRTW